MAAGEVSTLLETIESLLREPPSGGAAAIARIEETLTEGYAHALELEAERWRLERRIADVARGLAAGETADGAQELPALYVRLADADGEVKRLRAALDALRRHAAVVRAA